ncbi:MAG: sulfatase-like hydrolase/transferase [Verrucomicrobiota bacterium]
MSAIPRFLFLSLVFHTFAVAGQPNVLLIYTDDQGAIDAGCYGSPDLETPAIDKLAAEGVRFTQMLAPSAICSASRTGLLTGSMPMRAGVPGNVSSSKGNSGLPTANYTMAEMLHDAGYRTHHVGKWHLGYDEATMPNGQGFDSSWGHMGGCIDNYSHFFYWNGPNRHDLWRDGVEIWEDGQNFGHRMAEETKAVIDSTLEKPFFIYWAINWPHYPLQGYDHWRKHYAEKGLESPRDKYAAFVSSMDDLIGEVLDHLEAQGLAENTIVIFQSDHGHSVEERTFGSGGDPGPYRGHKGNFFEGGLRVPSIVRWPARIPKGEVRDQFVTGCDCYPTLLDWCGGSADLDAQKIDGKSIAKVIESGVESPHEQFYWTFGDRKDKQGNDISHWAYRQGDWKLIGNAKDQVMPVAAEDRKLFLANLGNDIGETTNVAKAHPEVVEQMLKDREVIAAELRADLQALRK